ncbi:MAG: glycosyltransferase family 2 protein, partial [Paludibacter sp.]|nr:glycosyltransferase family 2 protein [Paludibacter sp.]
MNNQTSNSAETKTPFRGKGVINCFVACNEIAQTEKTVQQIIQSPLVKTVYLLVKKGANIQLKDCQTLEIDSIQSSKTIQLIAEKSDTSYSFIYTKDTTLELGQ